jgi:hypothetical protein
MHFFGFSQNLKLLKRLKLCGFSKKRLFFLTMFEVGVFTCNLSIIMAIDYLFTYSLQSSGALGRPLKAKIFKALKTFLK